MEFVEGATEKTDPFDTRRLCAPAEPGWRLEGADDTVEMRLWVMVSVEELWKLACGVS